MKISKWHKFITGEARNRKKEENLQTYNMAQAVLEGFTVDLSLFMS